MYPFARAERLQLRKKESVDGRGVRDRGRLAGELRGEHERGYRTDTEIEKQDYFLGGGIYVHRSVDSTACLPRQLGQEPFILRRYLSPEPGADFHIHGRSAETGHDKGADYRLGSVQRGYRNIQARKDGLPGPHPAERGDGGAPALPSVRRSGNTGSRYCKLNGIRNGIFMLFLQREMNQSNKNNPGQVSASGACLYNIIATIWPGKKQTSI